MKKSNSSRKKTAGFYLGLITAALSAVTAFLFFNGFHASSYMDWSAVMLPIVAGAAFVLLSLCKLPAPLPALVMGLLNFAALLIFIHSTYLIYSEIFFGGFNWSVIVKADNLYYFGCTLLYILNVVLSNVCIYKKPYRENA